MFAFCQTGQNWMDAAAAAAAAGGVVSDKSVEGESRAVPLFAENEMESLLQSLLGVIGDSNDQMSGTTSTTTKSDQSLVAQIQQLRLDGNLEPFAYQQQQQQVLTNAAMPIQNSTSFTQGADGSEQERIRGDVSHHLNNIFLPPILGDPHPPPLQKIEYCTDNFRMYSFKVQMCGNEQEHDWMECPFGHPGEKACRRDPQKYNYVGTACPDFRKGACKRGDACGYAHGVFECWLHPSRYRTQLCQSGVTCNRNVCFFAHSLKEIRSPIHQPYKGQSSLENICPPPFLHPANANIQQNEIFSFVQRNEVFQVPDKKINKLCQLIQVVQQLNFLFGGERGGGQYNIGNSRPPQYGLNTYQQQEYQYGFQNLLQSLDGNQQIGYSWGDGFGDNAGQTVEQIRQM